MNPSASVTETGASTKIFEPRADASIADFNDAAMAVSEVLVWKSVAALGLFLAVKVTSVISLDFIVIC